MRAFMTTPLYAADKHNHDDVFFIGIDDARADPFDERIDDACSATYYIARARVIFDVERKRRNKDDDDEEQRLREKG